MNKNIAKEARKGGRALKKKYGLAYYQLLGKKSVKKRKELREKALALLQK